MMKKFYLENSKTIVKFVTTQIVMSLLGIMVGLAILAAEGDSQGVSVIAVIGSLFTAGFMCFLQYDSMFFAGEREGIQARAEGKKPDSLKGLKMALLGFSPTLLVAAVTIILSLFASDDAKAVSLLVYYAFQGSYLSLYKIREALGVELFVIITLLPVLISATLGFFMGTKDMPIRKAMGFDVKPPYDGPVVKTNKNSQNGNKDD